MAHFLGKNLLIIECLLYAGLNLQHVKRNAYERGKLAD